MMMIHHHLFTFNRFFTIFIFVPRLLKPPRTIFLHIRSQTPSIFVCLCCFSRSVKLFNTRNPRSLKVTPRNYFQEKDRFQRLFYSDITSSYHFSTDSYLHKFMTLFFLFLWECARAKLLPSQLGLEKTQNSPFAPNKIINFLNFSNNEKFTLRTQHDHHCFSLKNSENWWSCWMQRMVKPILLGFRGGLLAAEAATFHCTRQWT